MSYRWLWGHREKRDRETDLPGNQTQLLGRVAERVAGEYFYKASQNWSALRPAALWIAYHHRPPRPASSLGVTLIPLFCTSPHAPHVTFPNHLPFSTALLVSCPHSPARKLFHLPFSPSAFFRLPLLSPRLHCPFTFLSLTSCFFPPLRPLHFWILHRDRACSSLGYRNSARTGLRIVYDPVNFPAELLREEIQKWGVGVN